jgi:hypothetical protein
MDVEILRQFVLFIMAIRELASKTRVGARVQKRYHPPATPCARLLALDCVAEPVKERLRAVAATLDPLRLLDEVRENSESPHPGERVAPCAWRKLPVLAP